MFESFSYLIQLIRISLVSKHAEMSVELSVAGVVQGLGPGDTALGLIHQPQMPQTHSPGLLNCHAVKHPPARTIHILPSPYKHTDIGNLLRQICFLKGLAEQDLSNLLHKRRSDVT